MDESVRLILCDGNPCPRCKCCDTTVLQEPHPNAWYATGMARCNHCGKRFPIRNRQPHPAMLENPEPMQLPPVSNQSTGPFSTRVDVMQPSVAIHSDPCACPTCGGKGLVKSTQGPVQYRQCKECGERYKTQKFAG